MAEMFGTAGARATLPDILKQNKTTHFVTYN